MIEGEFAQVLAVAASQLDGSSSACTISTNA
jgi:hypothetical protein